MKNLMLLFVFFVSPLTCYETNPLNFLDSYYQYTTNYPQLIENIGSADKGEIEIILDKDKIAEIEALTGRVVGVVAEDKYWMWINDAVQFPNKSYGVYGRILWKHSLTAPDAAFVLPILPDGKIALIRCFRHATRSWEYEIPRGGPFSGETSEEAAAREVKEETGLIISDVKKIGTMAPDTGVLSCIGHAFIAYVQDQQEAEPEDAEAIASLDAFSLDQLKKGFIDGYLEKEIEGEIKAIPLRDPFLAFALFQAEARGFIK